jgi:hypothetical protein
MASRDALQCSALLPQQSRAYRLCKRYAIPAHTPTRVMDALAKLSAMPSTAVRPPRCSPGAHHAVLYGRRHPGKSRLRLDSVRRASAVG